MWCVDGDQTARAKTLARRGDPRLHLGGMVRVVVDDSDAGSVAEYLETTCGAAKIRARRDRAVEWRSGERCQNECGTRVKRVVRPREGERDVQWRLDIADYAEMLQHPVVGDVLDAPVAAGIDSVQDGRAARMLAQRCALGVVRAQRQHAVCGHGPSQLDEGRAIRLQRGIDVRMIELEARDARTGWPRVKEFGPRIPWSGGVLVTFEDKRTATQARTAAKAQRCRAETKSWIQARGGEHVRQQRRRRRLAMRAAHGEPRAITRE